MEILFLLVSISVLLVLAIMAVFGWAVYNGQLDHLDREGERILHDD